MWKKAGRLNMKILEEGWTVKILITENVEEGWTVKYENIGRGLDGENIDNRKMLKKAGRLKIEISQNKEEKYLKKKKI